MSDEIRRIHREPRPIMFRRVPDELPAMQQAWAELETLVGMRGRKFYGVFDADAVEYHVCAGIRPDDPADRYGLEVGELAGGTYLQLVLKGEPPEVYLGIGPGFERLESTVERDVTRHVVEFYKRRDVVELWQPVTR